MNYLKVPDSNIKLTDGSVVMLARFPGTKWVVHYGWYEYSGRRGMGWYFSSIPAQTVIPVTSQDLQLIVVIDPGKEPDHPAPPVPPEPGPAPGPWPPQPGPAPGPDSGLYPVPPDPYGHHPSGDPRAFFSKNDQFLLDASWITLPSIRYRDALSTVCNVPNGKVVKIVSVDGVTRYYSWNAPDQRWDEKFYENDAEKLLVNYYTREEIDEFLSTIDIHLNNLDEMDVTLDNKIDASVADLEQVIADEAAARIAADEAEIEARGAAIQAEAEARAGADAILTTNLNELSDRVERYQQGLDSRFEALEAADEELAGNLQALHNLVDSEFESLKERVSALEDAVFNIRTIVAGNSNTVLVSQEGTLKDSGVNIGDGVISEPETYASDKTLATEKAVVRIVDENATQWSSF